MFKMVRSCIDNDLPFLRQLIPTNMATQLLQPLLSKVFLNLSKHERCDYATLLILHLRSNSKTALLNFTDFATGYN